MSNYKTTTLYWKSTDAIHYYKCRECDSPHLTLKMKEVKRYKSFLRYILRLKPETITDIPIGAICDDCGGIATAERRTPPMGVST